MKNEQLGDSGPCSGRYFVVVLDDGGDAFAAISRFAEDQKIGGVSFWAIGPLWEATRGFDFASTSDKEIPVAEQTEVLRAIGDITTGDDGRASLHVHVVLGLSDGSTTGGHL